MKFFCNSCPKAVGMKPFISLFLSTKNYEIWLKIDRDMGKRMKTYLPSLFHLITVLHCDANLCYMLICSGCESEGKKQPFTNRLEQNNEI